MRIIALLLVVALTGCAPRLSFANEAGGVVNKSGSMGNDRAYALANDHCATFGKIARITSQDVLMNTMRFDCVAR